ncbi:MAG: hypothetical protein ACI8VL_002267, partial [Bacteroidia bacterium]
MQLSIFKTSFLSAIIVMVLSVFQTQAGTIDKAFEALEVKDYFKARELFTKLERKDKLAGNFGLCLVHVAKQNAFYNLDSALVYSKRSESFWRLASDKDKKNLAPYGISEKGIEGLRIMVYMFATDEALTENSLKACNDFLRRFPSAPQKKKILDLKATISFNDAKTAGSSVAIKKFIKDFPGSPETVEAKSLFERFLFEEQTKEGSIESFKNFTKDYPDSPFKRQADDKIFELSMANATVKSVHQFVRENPNSPYYNDAWRKLFRLYAPELDAESLADFKLEYP